MNIGIITIIISFIVTEAKLPINQYTISGNLSSGSATNLMAEINALKNADIFREEYSEMKSKYHGMRGILSPDMQILASAVVFGNVKLITEDEPFQTLAAKYIPVSGIPEPDPVHPSLF